MVERLFDSGHPCRLGASPHVVDTAARARRDARKGEATMSDAIHLRIAPPAKWSVKEQTHPAVVQACLVTSNGERTEIIWEAPTDCEWRRAVWVIAKQVTMHIAGYRDDDEFARDGCRFAWDVFETLHLPTRRDH